MTDNAPELLPCPFCGGRGIDNASAPLPYVYCEICDAHGPACDTLKAAFEWWNARADHAQAEQEAADRIRELEEGRDEALNQLDSARHTNDVLEAQLERFKRMLSVRVYE